MRSFYKGIAEVKYNNPVGRFEVDIYEIVPYEAKITGVTVHYVTGVDESKKRHDAAVKANATRKAKKEGGAK